jgi:hypothetical protein
MPHWIRDGPHCKNRTALGTGAFNLADPQSLDRYAYVRNSPMSLVDPLGLDCEWVETSGPMVEVCWDVDWGGGGGPIWQNHRAGYDKGMGGGGPGGAPVPPHKPQKQTSTCPSDESINNYLASKNSPMVGQGTNFMTSGEQFNLDPRLLVSLAGAETTFGRNITAGQFNALNVMYNGYNSPFAGFQSNINSAAMSLTNPRNGYNLASATTMYGRYCSGPGCATGLNNVNEFMQEQGANPKALHNPCPEGDALILEGLA